MGRQNLTRKVNGLCAIIATQAEIMERLAKVFLPEGDETLAAIVNTRNMAIGLSDPSAGFPVATDLEQPVASQEVVT